MIRGFPLNGEKKEFCLSILTISKNNNNNNNNVQLKQKKKKMNWIFSLSGFS